MAKEIKRIDEAAIARVLQRSAGTAAEVILRFAWNAGLSSGEMRELKWQDISFEPAQLYLPDRAVPMEEPLLQCLRERKEMTGAGPAEYVFASGPDRVPLHRVSIGRLAREVLDGFGLTEVTLTDLRDDYMLRQLKKHDWPYVARVSGLSLTTLRRRFAGTAEAARATAAAADVTEESLRQLIEREGTSTVGLAVALSWRAGLRGTELAALTWAQVNFASACIRLPDRDEPMDTLLEQLLRQAHEERIPQETECVLLTPKTGRPISDGHLSRMVRHTLIRSGMDDLTLGTLAKRHREGEDSAVLAYVREHGSVSRNEAVTLLKEIGERKAWRRLRRLAERGQLVKIGQRYYAPGTVVPVEEQYPVIRGYLEEHGGAYRQELAELLGLELRVCGWILHNLVEEGRLEMDRQWYTLPLEEDET